MSQTLVKTDLLDIRYLKDHNCIRIQWLSYPSSEEFRDGMNQLLEGLLAHNCKNILAAEGKMGAVSDEDQRWVIEDWTPRCFKTVGNAKTGIILSDDIFNQMATEEMVSQSTADTSLTKYFKSEEDALKWL
jgi:hypothetical protein